MSMSEWFRDYVYIALGGNRVKGYRVVVNLLITFIVTGLWHGASYNFLVWGLFHGFFIMIERWSIRGYSVPHMLQHSYVLMVVVVSWVIFRAPDMEYAWEFLKKLWSIDVLNFSDTYRTVFIDSKFYLMFAISIVMSTPILRDLVREISILKTLYLPLLLACFFLSLMYLSAGTYDPFIYFRF